MNITNAKQELNSRFHSCERQDKVATVSSTRQLSLCLCRCPPWKPSLKTVYAAYSIYARIKRSSAVQYWTEKDGVQITHNHVIWLSAAYIERENLFTKLTHAFPCKYLGIALLTVVGGMHT